MYVHTYIHTYIHTTSTVRNRDITNREQYIRRRYGEDIHIRQAAVISRDPKAFWDHNRKPKGRRKIEEGERIWNG